MTTAFPGYGSKLLYSTDGTNCTTAAQLHKFSPQGLKHMIVDQIAG